MIMNLPNKLTLFRVVLIPLFLALLLGNFVGAPLGRYLAIGIFIVASLTDALDGYIARSQNLVTTFGKFMDPLADKLLVSSALIAMIELGYLSAWIVVVIISREFIIQGFRLIAVEKNLVIAAGFWGKFKTIVTMLMIIFVLCDFPGAVAAMISTVLIVLTVLLTLFSMAEYLYRNKDVLR